MKASTFLFSLSAISFISVTIQPAAFTQESSSMFPGRRIGGATRGPCPQYLLANFVPPSNSIQLTPSDNLLIFFSGKPIQTSSISVTLRNSTLSTTHIFTPTSKQGFLSFNLSRLSPGSYVIESSTVCARQPLENIRQSNPAVSQLLITTGPLANHPTPYVRYSQYLTSKCKQELARDDLNILGLPPIDLLPLLSSDSVQIYCSDI